MKKLWSYISIFLLGIIGGILAWEKIDVKTVYKGDFRIRQKGKGNTQTPTINLETGEKAAKSGRKMDRVRVKVEKRKQKALKRLEKYS